MKKIPYNIPYLTGREKAYIEVVLSPDKIGSDGFYTERCVALLEELCLGSHALITPSCSAALEMAVRILALPPASEIILPSYSFSSAANAILLAGHVPVFADVEDDTLNLDPACVADLITDKTRAIMPVHYAGLCCNMEALNAIADKHGLYVIEDAAQAVGTRYRGNTPGTFGHLGTFSFHSTKNIIGGEGGALLVNDSAFLDAAHIFRDKGTNRHDFLQGKIDKYRWLAAGSSMIPAELTCAVMAAQLEALSEITDKRRTLWYRYDAALRPLAESGRITIARLLETTEPNGHIFWLVCKSAEERAALAEYCAVSGIQTTTHFVPLHSSPCGMKYGKTPRALPVTERSADALLRLPIYPGLTLEAQDMIIDTVRSFF